MESLDLTISIVNHSNPDLLKECLQSLFASTHGVNLDVWVVDNATDGRGVDEIHQAFPQVHWLYNKTRLGFSANHNQVLSQCRSRYACILNDDTIVHDHAFDLMVKLLDENPQVGMVGPRLLNSDGTIQNATFRFMTLFSELIDVCFLPQSLNRLKSAGVDTAQVRDEVSEVDWILGACIVARRECLQQVGLLDSVLSPIANTEDVDWCMRAHKSGWRVAHYPQAAITHLGGSSVARQGPGSDAMRVELHRTRLRFFRKHYGRLSECALRLIYCVALPWNALMLTQSLIRRRLARADFIFYLRTSWRIALASILRDPSHNKLTCNTGTGTPEVCRP